MPDFNRIAYSIVGFIVTVLLIFVSWKVVCYMGNHDLAIPSGKIIGSYFPAFFHELKDFFIALTKKG